MNGLYLGMRARRAHVATLLAVAINFTLIGRTQTLAAAGGATPRIGEQAADFSLASIDGPTIRLSGELARGPVVLILLRGFPGYQCPFFTKQFGDFLVRAKEFDAMGARVIWVYPGPADQLKQHAEEFLAGSDRPANFRFLLDPAYTFTEAYGLRWNAPSETAYPSTFVIDRGSIVRFAQISHAHDGRARAADVLEALARLDR